MFLKSIEVTIVGSRKPCDQDFHFGHLGTGRMVEPRLCCNVLRTACTFGAPFFVDLAKQKQTGDSLLFHS